MPEGVGEPSWIVTANKSTANHEVNRNCDARGQLELSEDSHMQEEDTCFNVLKSAYSHNTLAGSVLCARASQEEKACSLFRTTFHKELKKQEGGKLE